MNPPDHTFRSSTSLSIVENLSYNSTAFSRRMRSLSSLSTDSSLKLKCRRPKSSVYNSELRCIKGLKALPGTNYIEGVSPIQQTLSEIKNQSIERRRRKLSYTQIKEIEEKRVIKRSTELMFGVRIAVQVHKWCMRAKNRVRSQKERDSMLRKQFINEYFRRAVKATILTHYFMKSMIDTSIKLHKPSVLEMQYHAKTESEKDMREKKFAILDFESSENNQQDNLPGWAKIILFIKPEHRTENDINQLLLLLRGLEGFEKFSRKMQFEMGRSMYFLGVQPRRVILRQGHIGLSFYLIYTGSVFVSSSGQNGTNLEAILTKGMSFGDLASIIRGVERHETVTCREECELLCIEKRIFEDVCPRVYDNEIELRINFIKEHYLFREYWDLVSIQSLCLFSHIAEYPINQFITKDTVDDSYIYFVLEGKCMIMKLLELNMSKAIKGSFRKMSIGSDIDVDSCLQFSEEENEIDIEAILNKKKAYISASTEQSTRNDMRKMMNQTNSVTVYMNLKKKLSAEQNKIAIFISVKSLEKNDVLNLPEEKRNSKNSLMLVSEKCKVLKMRKSDFIRCYKNQEKQRLIQGKIFELQTQYPSDDALLDLYRSNCDWEAYKQRTVDSVVSNRIQSDSDDERFKQVVENKPWRANASRWLTLLNEKQRIEDMRKSAPLYNPIY